MIRLDFKMVDLLFLEKKWNYGTIRDVYKWKTEAE